MITMERIASLRDEVRIICRNGSALGDTAARRLAEIAKELEEFIDSYKGPFDEVRMEAGWLWIEIRVAQHEYFLL